MQTAVILYRIGICLGQLERQARRVVVWEDNQAVDFAGILDRFRDNPAARFRVGLLISKDFVNHHPDKRRNPPGRQATVGFVISHQLGLGAGCMVHAAPL